MNVLAKLLDAVKLCGDVFFRCAFSSPWVMDIGQKPVAEFHLIVEGSCCVSISGHNDKIVLHPGDIVLFPHGHAHVLLMPQIHLNPSAHTMATLVQLTLSSCGTSKI